MFKRIELIDSHARKVVLEKAGLWLFHDPAPPVGGGKRVRATTAVLIDEETGAIYTAVSVCSEGDSFEKKVGRLRVEEELARKVRRKQSPGILVMAGLTSKQVNQEAERLALVAQLEAFRDILQGRAERIAKMENAVPQGRLTTSYDGLDFFPFMPAPSPYDLGTTKQVLYRNSRRM